MPRTRFSRRTQVMAGQHIRASAISECQYTGPCGPDFAKRLSAHSGLTSRASHCCFIGKDDVFGFAVQLTRGRSENESCDCQQKQRGAKESNPKVGIGHVQSSSSSVMPRNAGRQSRLQHHRLCGWSGQSAHARGQNAADQCRRTRTISSVLRCNQPYTTMAGWQQNYR